MNSSPLHVVPVRLINYIAKCLYLSCLWMEQLLSIFFYAVTGCKDKIVMVKILARSSDVGQGDGDTGSVDSHAMTTPSLKVAGHILAAALYVLNQCPVHSRYVRRGLGKRETFQVDQFLPRSIEQVRFTASSSKPIMDSFVKIH